MAAHLPTVTVSIRVSPGFHKSYVHLADENPSIIFFFSWTTHNLFSRLALKIQKLGLSLDAEIELDPKHMCLPCPDVRMRPREQRETQLLQIFSVISVCAEEVEICGEGQQ